MSTYPRAQKIHKRSVILAVSFFVGLGFILQLGITAARSEEYSLLTSKRPNILFDLTGDLDSHSTKYLGGPRNIMAQNGTTFKRAYVSD